MRLLKVIPVVLAILLTGCNADVQTTGDPVGTSSSDEDSPRPEQPSPTASPSGTHTSEALAKGAVDQFLAATRSNDIDALTALAEAPFLLDGEILASTEELRTQFMRMLEKKELLAKLTFEIREVTAFETISKTEMSGEVGNFIKGNLRDGDQIVIADLLLPDRKPDRHAHYVRVRSGNARIVGLLDVPVRD